MRVEADNNIEYCAARNSLILRGMRFNRTFEFDRRPLGNALANSGFVRTNWYKDEFSSEPNKKRAGTAWERGYVGTSPVWKLFDRDTRSRLMKRISRAHSAVAKCFEDERYHGITAARCSSRYAPGPLSEVPFSFDTSSVARCCIFNTRRQLCSERSQKVCVDFPATLYSVMLSSTHYCCPFPAAAAWGVT